MSCKIPCHGLYSDVEHETAGETIGLETPGMAQLMKEYQAYKRGNLLDPVPYIKGLALSQFAPVKTYLRCGTGAATARCEHLLQHPNC